jgi:plasmid stabilization system protein ParE
MDVTLSIIGIAFLMVLLAISWSKQRQEKRERIATEGARHSPEAAAQYEQSMQRRAAVRAAHAERTRAEAQVADTET